MIYLISIKYNKASKHLFLMAIKQLRQSASLLGLVGIIAITGCEQSSNDSSSNEDSTYTNSPSQKTDGNSDGGSSRNDSQVIDLGGHMFNGEKQLVTARVRAGQTYNVALLCSNDGDSDTINIYADGNSLGSYQTAENRLGGSGWYVDQRGYYQPFVAASDTVVFTIETKTDSWGTWPKSLELSLASPK